MQMNPPVLKYYEVADRVSAFYTTRKGGVSCGCYGGFNVNAFCGDDETHVTANRRLLAKELGVAKDRLIIPHQTHGIESRMIAEEFFGLPGRVRQMLLEGIDCVMTDVPGVCIGVSTADCIPLLFYDRAHHAAAAVHAGWRGTLNKIAHKAVVEMHHCFKTVPQDVVAVIGPGISLANFEVGQEVYEQFAQLGNDMERIAKMYDKWHIDLPECNRLQLVEAGVPERQILSADICTYDHCDEFFSARRLGIGSGRIYTGIVLR